MQIAAKTLFTVCSLSMVVGIASGNLMTNPSFETPVVPVGSFQAFNTGSAAITGWTVTGAAGTQVAIVSTAFVQNGVSFEAEDGNQWLDLTGVNSNSTEGIVQTVATTPGTNYILTFFIGNTTGGGIFGTTSTDALKINGTQVSTFTNSNSALSSLNWEKFTDNFAAASMLTTIEFDNLDPASDNSNALDLVDLEVGSASIPEPASVGLVESALAVIAFRMRRRSSRSS